MPCTWLYMSICPWFCCFPHHTLCVLQDLSMTESFPVMLINSSVWSQSIHPVAAHIGQVHGYNSKAYSTYHISNSIIILLSVYAFLPVYNIGICDTRTSWWKPGNLPLHSFLHITSKFSQTPYSIKLVLLLIYLLPFIRHLHCVRSALRGSAVVS